MEIQTLANILVASSVAHGLHSMGEPVNIIKKVKRLDAYINKQTPPKIPGGIDTRTKALGLAFGFNAILFILAFLLVSIIDPSTSAAIWFAVGVMVIVEIVNSIAIDHYHVLIERVTKKFK